MTHPPNYDFRRYLRAKRSVEARALNREVWEQMALQISELDRPIRLLELGAGIGSMALRFLENGLLKQASYTLVEREAAYLQEAKKTLLAGAKENGYQAEESAEGNLILIHQRNKAAFHFVTSDAADFLESSEGEPGWDLLIAHAFLDLFDMQSALPQFLGALRPKGYFYFPINYDGLTAFEPQFDPVFETELLTLYHRSMDERLVDGLPSGDSQTGRHLFAALSAAGGLVLTAGSSDWLVFPRDAEYPADEAYFLHYILHTIETEFLGQAELDAASLQEWLSTRNAQIENAELLFIAHNLDFFGQKKA